MYLSSIGRISRIVAVSLLITLAAVCAAGNAAPPERRGPGSDPMQKVRVFQQLLKECKARGIDTSRAEELDRQSLQAARSGNKARAAELIDEAISLLDDGRHPQAPAQQAVTPAAAPAERPAPPEGFRQRDGGRPEGRPGAGGQAGKRRGGGDKPKVSAESFPEPSKGEKPVFVIPFTHHYDGPGGYYATAGEVRAMAEFFNRNKIPGTLFFDGILVERLKKQDPAIFDLVNSYRLPLGYHGEETHGPYPVASDLCAEVYPLNEAQGYDGRWSITTGQDWNSAVEQVTERYSYGRPYTIDESTHMLDRRSPSNTDKGRKGGIKLVQEAFGRDVSMMTSHGLESAPEGYAFRKLSGFGFDQPAVPIALHALKIFKVQSAAEKIMSIAGKDVSIFWFMGRLMCKGDDMGEASWHPVYIQKLNKLDRSEPRLLVMGFSKLDEEAAGETVKYLNDRFFPANPGSKWVSGDTLAENFEPEKGYSPSADDAGKIAGYILKNWQGRPPDMVETGGRVYSLTDAFETLTRALGSYSSASKLPDFVVCSPLYGPVTEKADACLRQAAELKTADIAAKAAGICGGWDSAEKDRFVPASVDVGGVKLNSAEMLYAMASAFVEIKNGGGRSISVSPAAAYPPYADCLDILFKPAAAQPLCYTKGQLWTVKPARLKNASASAAPSQPVKEAAAPSPNAGPPKSGSLDIVFAANLDGEGGCYREDPSGADLYRVTFDPAAKKASGLVRLTSGAKSAEWFPAISPDGKYVAYNRSDPETRGPRGHEIRLIDTASGRDVKLLGESRFPFFFPDGRTLAFSHYPMKNNQIVTAPVLDSGGVPALGEKKVVADRRHGSQTVEDPSVSPDGKWIAFHRKEVKGGACLGAIGADGNGFESLTPPTGFGHAAISPDGDSIVCSSSKTGSLAILTRKSGQWSRPVDLPLTVNAADFARYDARYSSMARLSHSYMEWLAPDLIIVSSQGADAQSKFHFSRIFLLRLDGFDKSPEIIDFSSAVEALAGKASRDFCTASGRVIK